jgi:hypothetical protein
VCNGWQFLRRNMFEHFKGPNEVEVAVWVRDRIQATLHLVYRSAVRELTFVELSRGFRRSILICRLDGAPAMVSCESLCSKARVRQL